MSHEEPARVDPVARRTGGLALWTLGWAASLALAQFGPGLIWDEQNATAGWIAVALNVVVGVGWIVAIIRYLRALDDLQRKIMIDALGVALGIGWILGFAFVVADDAGLIGFEVNLAALPVLMGVTFLVAFGVGTARYR